MIRLSQARSPRECNPTSKEPMRRPGLRSCGGAVRDVDLPDPAACGASRHIYIMQPYVHAWRAAPPRDTHAFEAEGQRNPAPYIEAAETTTRGEPGIHVASQTFRAVPTAAAAGPPAAPCRAG